METLPVTRLRVFGILVGPESGVLAIDCAVLLWRAGSLQPCPWGTITRETRLAPLTHRRKTHASRIHRPGRRHPLLRRLHHRAHGNEPLLSPDRGPCVLLFLRTIVFWGGVFLMGGIPHVEWTPLLLFVGLGVLQTATSLLQLTGIHRLGAARAEPLRNTYPLWSAVIAIVFLGEKASPGIIAGTLLVVGGITLISWQPAESGLRYRWWEGIFSLTAALFAGVAFPIRRIAFDISNEPLYFAAVLAIVSFVSLGPRTSISVSGPSSSCSTAARCRRSSCRASSNPPAHCCRSSR